MRHRILAAAAIAAMTLGLFSCDAAPTAPRLDQLTLDVVSGNGQSGVVGTEVAPLIVIVRSNGNPVPLQVLNFRVVSGGGSVYGGTELTDNDGIAQEIWTLGTDASQPQQVEVRAVESSTGAQKVFATFTATAIADRAYSLSASAGNNQTAVAGSAVPISPAVRVADRYGNPIGGVNVTFAVGPASGTATGVLQTTDANGIAAVGTWTLSGTAGPNTLLATTPGVILAGRPVTFTAVGIAGNAAQLAILSGNNQAASPGATLPNQPTVRVMDANGNGVPNVAVTFTVRSGGGSIDGVGSVTTLTSTGGSAALAGSAAVNWTLGSAAGSNTLQATAVGLNGSPVVFSATVVPPPTITSFTAAASTITAGTSTTLTAVFSGGTGTVDHGVGAVTSGTPVSTGPLSTTTTFTLTVTNSVRVSVTATVTVTVVPPPSITSFSAAASTISSGSSTTLTGVFSGGSGSIDHGLGAVTSGTPVSTGPLTATTTYTLTVTNSAGATANASVTVTVVQRTWISQSPTGGPPASRWDFSSVYDAGTNTMIVFGGQGGVTNGRPLLNDVWVLSGANGIAPAAWMQLNPTGTAPSPRAERRTAYDPNTNRMILFGGNPNVGNCFGVANDLWVLTNANGQGGTPAWIQLTPPTAGPTRQSPSVVYDPSSNTLLSFGGLTDACGSPTNDVWLLRGANGFGVTPSWSQLATVGGPPPAGAGHSGVYDRTTNAMIVFGGALGNAVWVLSNANGVNGTPTWTQLSPSGTPPSGRNGHGATYDPSLNTMTIFGGTGSGGETNDVWVLSHANGTGGTPAWTQLTPSNGPPVAREGHAAIYDPASNRMTVYAGIHCSGGSCGLLGDVWVLTGANGR